MASSCPATRARSRSQTLQVYQNSTAAAIIYYSTTTTMYNTTVYIILIQIRTSATASMASSCPATRARTRSHTLQVYQNSTAAAITYYSTTTTMYNTTVYIIFIQIRTSATASMASSCPATRARSRSHTLQVY